VPPSSAASGAIPDTAHPAVATPTGPRRDLPWPAVLLALWIAGAGLATGRLLVAATRLRRILAERRPFPAGRLVRLLAERLRIRRPVRLSACPRLEVPLAMGLRHPEVCFPEAALAELRPRQREALFAHELAHLGRRDPAWLLAGRVVETALFLQPLNRIACRRLRLLAEYLADDLAVGCTGRRHDLARCLVDVAARLRGEPQTAVAAAALAAPSDLSARVRRLLGPAHSDATTPRGTAVALACTLAVAALVMPGISCSTADAEAGPTVTRTWSTADDAPAAKERPAKPARAPKPPKASPSPAAVPAPEVPPAPPSALPAPEPAPAPRRAVGTPPDPETVAALEDVLRESQRLAEEVAGDLGPELEELARHLSDEQAKTAGSFELDEEEIRVIQEQARRAATEAARLAEACRPSDEELARLAAEVAERTRMTAEDVERIKAEALAAARERMLDHDELEREIREAHQLAREELERDRERIRVELRELERQSREVLRDREEIERRVREAHREAERELRRAAEAAERARREAVREAERESERRRREAERRREEAPEPPR
jgi:beta-lactamase regulating signal transducer with metallopeptidase domain